MPDKYNELITVFNKLEGHYKDMQDIEFVHSKINCGYCKPEMVKELQGAAIKIAVDIVR